MFRVQTVYTVAERYKTNNLVNRNSKNQIKSSNMPRFFSEIGLIEGILYSFGEMAFACKFTFTITHEKFEYKGNAELYTPGARELFLKKINLMNKTADKLISKNFGEFSVTLTLEQTAVPNLDQILT